MTAYCVSAERAQLVWHYSKQRPFHGYGISPDAIHIADCSAYVSLVFNWAMHTAQAYLADPLGLNYSGYGYTGTELNWLKWNAKSPGGPFLPGDLAVYGQPGSNGSHTVVCRKQGTDKTAVWSSNGSESAPNAVKLHDHPDPLMGVWRHPALA